MKFLSSAETAKKWNISERAVRGYCAQGRIPDAFLTGKTWNIPETAEKPSRIPRARKAPATLLEYLRREKEGGLSGGIYHKVQIDLTYNSNHIEGSRLTHDQTRYIFETNTIGVSDQAVDLDDVLETANHFRCIDMIIDNAARPLSEHFILELHAALKNGTSDSRKGWFAVGKYKRMPNEVGGHRTAAPEEVPRRMRELLASYSSTGEKTLAELIDFHVRFETIHPFQDGNGRVGRLILFKECLRNDIVPFIINEKLKMFYYRGMSEWDCERGYLMDTCLTAQDSFKEVLDYFRIPYKK